MKLQLTILALVASLNVFAVVGIGEPVPNLCYTDVNEEEFCLDDAKGNVLVLSYGTGW